jgi:hypothetical protein
MSLKQKNVFLVFFAFFSFALINYYQNCTGQSPVDFSGQSSFQSLSANEQGGAGGFDGKPEPGSYCRVFDNVSCQTQVANLQSVLSVDNTAIHLTSDNCASTSTDFEFSNIAVSTSQINRTFIGLSRGIFKKCEPDKPATEMADAWCRSKNNDVDIVINKNIATKKLDLSLLFRNSGQLRAVSTSSIAKTQNGSNTIYTSTREQFDLNITNSIAQTSTGKLNALIDNHVMNVDVDCHQANPEPTIIINRDLEIHSSWIDTTRLAGYWKLNEVNATEGTVIVDSSATAFNGVLQTQSDGLNKSNSTVPGGAISFDGVDDQIMIGTRTDNTYNFDTRSFTYMVWIYKTSTAGTWDRPIYKGSGSPGMPGFDIECGYRGCSAFIGGGSSGGGMATAAFAPNGNGFVGRWVHLAAVVDRNSQELRAYVDGNLISTTSIATIGSLSIDIPLILGGDNFLGTSQVAPFLGSIDDAAIWSVALTPAEILEIAQRLRPKFN